MVAKVFAAALFSIAFILPGVSIVRSETLVRDSSILEIAHSVWQNDFPAALAGAKRLISEEPDNPLGYFLRGTVYQTISEEYRSDRYKDEIIELLGNAIAKAEDRRKLDTDQPDWHFISGASYGYRALHRAFHGRWWKAFRDGLRCSSRLKEALRLDSTFYDAYMGLGAYDYYKTVMAEDFLWLPFVSGRRKEGITQIRKAIAGGYLASHNARETLLPIYLNERRYDDLVLLADSLEMVNPDDPYCLLYYAEGLMQLDRFDEAGQMLRRLRRIWKESQYFDEAGLFEAELIVAEILYREGDSESARKITGKILTLDGLCDENAYFAETYNRTKALSRRLK
ncbi:MAG: hypothetical protein JSV44_10105 [Candidatus Zixiibacteriota bacterium]|nr:MAG: hypothetical protein JSV44_10105 [candidate division Zixibacteria bacterium]